MLPQKKTIVTKILVLTLNYHYLYENILFEEQLLCWLLREREKLFQALNVDCWVVSSDDTRRRFTGYKNGQKCVLYFPNHGKANRQNDFILPQRVQFPTLLHFITIIYTCSKGMQFVTKLGRFHLTPNFTLHMCKLIHEVQISGELRLKAENYCLVIKIL